MKRTASSGEVVVSGGNLPSRKDIEKDYLVNVGHMFGSILSDVLSYPFHAVKEFSVLKKEVTYPHVARVMLVSFEIIFILALQLMFYGYNFAIINFAVVLAAFDFLFLFGFAFSYFMFMIVALLDNTMEEDCGFSVYPLFLDVVTWLHVMGCRLLSSDLDIVKNYYNKIVDERVKQLEKKEV